MTPGKEGCYNRAAHRIGCAFPSMKKTAGTLLSSLVLLVGAQGRASAQDVVFGGNASASTNEVDAHKKASSSAEREMLAVGIAADHGGSEAEREWAARESKL